MANNEIVLIIEDDKQIRNYISFALTSEGYKCLAADTADDGLHLAVLEKVDLIILDLGLPDFDGTEVIKKLREWSEIPIIVVSARDREYEKVNALDLGADDYITKPFSASELLARIRVCFRHYFAKNIKENAVKITVGDLAMDCDKHLVFLRDKEIHLTPMEYKLLFLLMKNAGKVLTSGTIIKEIWGVGYGNDTQSLRAIMAGLRRKIETNPAMPKYILTEIGVGYRMKEN